MKRGRGEGQILVITANEGRRIRVVRERRDAEADRARGVGVGVGDRRAQPLGHEFGTVGGRARQDDGELLAAIAADHVDLPQPLLQDPSQPLQYPVARLVAAHERLFAVTREGRIYCFGKKEVKPWLHSLRRTLVKGGALGGSTQ